MNPLTQAVVSEVTKPVLDSLRRQIGYILNYSSNIQNLEEEIQKLTHAKQRVEHAVNEARQKPLEEIEEDIEEWLTKADDAIKEAGKILNEDKNRENKRCFIGLCPNLKTRRLISRKAKEKCEFVSQIARKQEEGRLNKVSYRVTGKGIGPVKDYEAFESRRTVFETIMMLLKGADVKLIGVFGMGGMGKTMLLSQIAAQVKADGIFEVVVQITADQTSNVNKIQEEIAEWLGFQLEGMSVPIRAKQLRKRLEREEKFLVVLDNIWTRIELEDIGIPDGKDHKGGKILISARNQNVLLEMGAQRSFRLDMLKQDEAWHLFEKYCGVVQPDKKEIAIQVAKRCAGLPILIEAVAIALRDKEQHEWTDALEELRQLDDKGMEAKVYSALELSYNFLDDEYKDLFLLCGQLLPNHISISQVLKYGIGMGIFKQRTTVKAARNRMLKVVDDLKRSCLLEEGDDKGCVKMHEVMHSFAVRVASNRHRFLTMESDSALSEWPKEQCTRIFLLNCKIPKLPDALDCRELQSFILHPEEPSLEIPDKYFGSMKELKLMDRRGMDLSLLPSSIQSLQNLQTLCLDKCKLEDISAIGKLEKLLVLSLCGSSIVRLPKEIGQLTRLRLLDLSDCSSLRVIPSNVLIRLVHLEDLYMRDSFVQWKRKGNDCAEDNASLDELNRLSNLNTLQLQIIDAMMLPEAVFSGKLERFKIFFGDDWDWSDTQEASKTLKLKLNRRLVLQRFKVLLMKTEDLYLNDLKGLKNVLYELDAEGFPRLKHLHIQNSDEIQFIVDSTMMGCSEVAFPKLESLFVDYSINLEKICHGTFQAEAFGSLRKLNVRNCTRLKNLFSLPMARNLGRLEEIDVSSCNIMEGIIAEVTEDGIHKSERVKLTKLASLTLENLPSFNGFCCSVNATRLLQRQSTIDVGPSEIVAEDEPDIELVLFSKKIEFPNLVDLKIKSINVEKIWPKQVRELSPSIQNLTSLIVEGCRKLSYVLESSMVESLAQLKKLEIGNCILTEEIIVTRGLREEMMRKTLFPKLDFLKLKGLPQLKRFCSGISIEFPSLKVLWVENCPHLRAFVHSFLGIIKGARQANSTLFDEKELHVLHMHKLRMIWENEEQADSFGKLKVVKIEHAKDLLRIFPSNMWRGLRNLEALVVKHCDLVEEVFDLREVMELRESRLVLALRILEIENLPMLKCIWNGEPHEILSLRNLRSVYAWDCGNLKSLFPASIAKGLVQLEELNIYDCGMEELIEEGSETSPTFIFPRLKFLQLWKSQELRNFYPRAHTLDCPVLEKLSVFHCEKLKVFEPESSNLEETSMNSGPLFCLRELAPNLKEMTLSEKETMMIKQGQLPPDLFHTLELLHLQCFHDESSSFPFDLLHIFQNLQKLLVACSYIEELFPSGLVGDDRNVKILAQIRHLRLDDLYQLRRIWINQESLLKQVLLNLQTLEVMHCGGLIALAPSSASFQNLTTLFVWDCNGLVNLLTSATAKSLVQLTTMTVEECKMVTQIVADEGEEGPQTHEITLTKLETLRLTCLKSLACFSFITRIMKFPSLTEVIVTQCPGMEFFCRGTLNTPKLNKVYMTEESDRWLWVGDLNTTIQQLRSSENSSPH